VTLILRPAAAADIEAAYRWYERHRAGLGDDFLASVRTALRAIEANPEAYPVVHRDARRVLIRRFPYGLFYRTVPEHIAVIACMHARRNPTQWRRRR
jgi:plasmid stabilization system protein ParE